MPTHLLTAGRPPDSLLANLVVTGNTSRVPRHVHVVGPSRKNVQTAKYLRAEIPRVAADDTFVAILADLAASSTPAPGRSRVGKTALRVRIAAVTASVALVSVGAAYAVERFGGDERAPVGPSDTVDPASPSEPDDRVEQDDGDLAPHDLDEGRENEPIGGAATGHGDDTGLPDGGLEGSNPETPAVVPAPQGRDGTDTDQDQSGPAGGPKGNSTPDTPDDTPGHTPQPTDDPDADPADPDTDADPSDADPSDADRSDADRSDADPSDADPSDAEVDNR
jgi:hypothetical protein